MKRKFKCKFAFPGFKLGEYYYSEDMFGDPEFTCMIDDQWRGNDFTKEEMERYFMAVPMDPPVPSKTLQRIVWGVLITIALIIITAVMWRS